MTATLTTTTEDSITLAWDDGATSRLSATWLRDNIPGGRHRAEGQRTFDINELDPPRIVGVAVEELRRLGRAYGRRQLIAAGLSGRRRPHVAERLDIRVEPLAQAIAVVDDEQVVAREGAALEDGGLFRDDDLEAPAPLEDSPRDQRRLPPVVRRNVPSGDLTRTLCA